MTFAAHGPEREICCASISCATSPQTPPSGREVYVAARSGNSERLKELLARGGSVTYIERTSGWGGYGVRRRPIHLSRSSGALGTASRASSATLAFRHSRASPSAPFADTSRPDVYRTGGPPCTWQQLRDFPTASPCFFRVARTPRRKRPEANHRCT